jgi:hypothetical protein
MPEKLHLSSLLRRGEVKAHRRGLETQARRGFVAAEQQTGFAATRAGQELQAEGGLTGARRAYQRRYSGRGNTAPEHRVERGDSG